MRRRERVVAAKRRILCELIEHLERDRSMEDADGILGIDALLVEFRRRAEVAAATVLPGQEALPGMGIFKITFLPDGATVESYASSGAPEENR